MTREELLKISKPVDYVLRGGEFKYTIKDKNGEEIELKHCKQKQIQK